jgi:hypothetical protein
MCGCAAQRAAGTGKAALSIDPPVLVDNLDAGGHTLRHLDDLSLFSGAAANTTW